MFEDAHFGCHDFDYGFPSGFVEFIGGYKSVTTTASGFDHGFILQGDFLRLGVYVVVCVFVTSAAGVKCD